MENTILFGNGFNRLRNSGISWEDVLNDLKKENFSNGNLPYTLIYEKSLLDGAKGQINTFTDYEFDVKVKLAELMKTIVPADIYKNLATLGLKKYLTTNYDYCLNQIFELNKLKDVNNSTEDIYSIRRKTTFYNEKNEEVSTIWNIHGEINKPISIMLGYDHYTGSLSKLESYVKGNYEFAFNRDSIKPKSMRSKILGQSDFDDYSWIESLFKDKVHIIGLKLDYSETDIYWILNKRKRFYTELGNSIKFKNEIIYYTINEDNHKHELLKSFGVKVIFKKGFNHSEIYDFALNNIK